MKYYNPNQNKNPQRKSNQAPYGKPGSPGIKQRVPHGKENIADKAKEQRRTSLTIKLAAIVAGLLVIAGISIFLPIISANAAYSEGYEVILNGQRLGAVDDPQAVQQALEAIQQEFSQVYGMQIYDDTTLEFNKIKIPGQYICPPQLYIDMLKQTIDIQVMAWVINVNSRPAVALKTQEEAQQVLSRILEPYQSVAEERDRSEIGFVENVEVQNAPIAYSNITDADSAYKIMVYGSADYEEKWHVVVTGDTLSRIAKKHGIKISDLRKANLSVAATDSIYPGDELLVIKPNNCVNVKYIKYIDRDEDYEAEPLYEYNDSMYVSEKYVKHEGRPGRWHINAKTVYINGIEASYDIMDSTVFEEALPAIIVKGTKSVPAIVEMASEGRMAFPLRNYTITSAFGYRNIEDQVAGASKFHMGVDLKASTGTPFYASASGTVKFAGSSSGYGLLINISHDGGVETRYAHCSQLLVEKGEHVKKGQLIGLSGNTGRSSGSHLHFEIRLNGVPQDPEGKYVGDVPGY